MELETLHRPACGDGVKGRQRPWGEGRGQPSAVGGAEEQQGRESGERPGWLKSPQNAHHYPYRIALVQLKVIYADN